MANRQGRVIGTNLAGGTATFPGYVGTWAIKLFDLSFCGAGLTAERVAAEGFDALGVGVEQLDRAHFYPEKNMMGLELVLERSTERVLGIQGAGPAGDALKARVDAVAGVLQYAKPTAADISNLAPTRRLLQPPWTLSMWRAMSLKTCWPGALRLSPAKRLWSCGKSVTKTRSFL
ncbi:hypothetical protein AGMMS50248_00450 [Deltaproteobacteria bacterium]|nr:hypothetical protein AGMMS50248_00450 [Deltaproteobacteria bacterium]